MDEQKQHDLVAMRRQITELGAKVWVARQRGDHKTAYDLELARDDLRRALTKLKQTHNDGAG